MKEREYLFYLIFTKLFVTENTEIEDNLMCEVKSK